MSGRIRAHGRSDPGAAAGEPLQEWEGGETEHWRERWRVPQLLLLRSVGSTNDAARSLAEAGAAAWTTVIADEQIAGRGRLGRRWQAPAGKALLMSLLLRPPRIPPPILGTMPLRVGLAVAHAIEALTGADARIEWPNDVLVGERKVAGILCEASLTGSSAGFVVVGIGVNVTLVETDFSDDDVRARATSLLLATGRSIGRPSLAGTLLRELRRAASGEVGALHGDIAHDLASRDALRGHLVLDANGERLGIGEGIDPDGALRIRTGDGRLRRLITGSVRAGPIAAPNPERGSAK